MSAADGPPPYASPFGPMSANETADLERIQLLPHGLPGRLVAVCGTDGTGKTTFVQMIASYLRERGERVCVTKQPTDEARNLSIFKKYLFDPEQREAVDYRALLCFVIGDRLQHIHDTVLPALRRGEFVVSDRYIFTQIVTTRTRGFQDEDWMYELYRHIPRPDLALLLDTSLDIAVQRVRARPGWRESFFERDHIDRNLQEYRRVAAVLDLQVINTSAPDPSVAFAEIASHLERLR